MVDIKKATDLPNGLYLFGGVHNGIAIQETSGRSGLESADGSSNTRRVFLVSGTSDPFVARAALIDGPVLINEFDDKQLATIEWDRGETPTSWEMTCNYAFVPEPGGYTVSIDTSGGSVLQTNAFAQAMFPATGETAIDYGTAIDVQDGSPQGVERVIPALKLTVNARIKSSYISSPIAYAKTLAGLTGYMCDEPYLGFAKGELLFIGASGEIVGEDPTLAFNFLAAKNITGLTIGDITGIDKLGHDYLWFDFKRGKDSTTKMPSSKPRAAYVGRIYGFASYDGLKIGA